MSISACGVDLPVGQRRVPVPPGAGLVAGVVAVHQIDATGDGLDVLDRGRQVDPGGMGVAGVQDEPRHRTHPPRPRAGRSPRDAGPSPCRRRRCSRSGSAAGTRRPPPAARTPCASCRTPTAGSASAVHVAAVHDQSLGAERSGRRGVRAEQLAAGDADPVVRGRHVQHVRRVHVDRRGRRRAVRRPAGAASASSSPAGRRGRSARRPRPTARLVDGIGVVLSGADVDTEHRHGPEGSAAGRQHRTVAVGDAGSIRDDD